VDPPGSFPSRPALIQWCRQVHGPYVTDGDVLVFRDGVQGFWNGAGDNFILTHPASEADALAGTLHYHELLVQEAEAERERVEAELVAEANRVAAQGSGAVPAATDVRDRLMALDREVDLAKHRFRAARAKFQRARWPNPPGAVPSRAVLRAVEERRQALAADATRLANLVKERQALRAAGLQSVNGASANGHADDRPKVRVGPLAPPELPPEGTSP
jgi:hypothetical protein